VKRKIPDRFLAIGLTDNKRKGANCSTPFYYRISISFIADRLLLSRACFLLKLIIKIKKFFTINNIINITEGTKHMGIETACCVLRLK